MHVHPQDGSTVTSRTKRLGIIYRPINELKGDLNNARVHSKTQLRQIAKSIRSFGFNVPVLIDRELHIIAGHGRVLAAGLAGLTELPTIMLEDLSDNQIRAFQIADNKLAENAEWNEKLLAEQLKALCAADLDFSVEAMGFEVGEIEVIIEGLAAAETDKEGAELIRSAREDVRVSRPGDLWLLGRNRLICGNALDPTTYSTLMDGTRAAMVFADPPYNVPIGFHAGGLGAIQHKEFQMAAGEMSPVEYTEFLRKACALLASNTLDGSVHFLCIDWRHIAELIAAASPVYATLVNICVWAKANAGMGSFYRSQHELIFVYKHGTTAHRNNIQLGQFGRYRSNVWNYPGANSSSRITEEDNLLELHPTVKPVSMVADAMLDCTARGEIVLDAFLGSGTSVIAAERTGRICYGIEIDPVYVDTAVRRWQKFTGLRAIHATSEHTFNDLEAEGTR